MTRQGTLKRRIIAERIAHQLKVLSNVDAIIITGSVGRLWADELSDVDLLVGWLEIPPAEERSALIDVLKDAGTRHMATDEFYEGYNIPLTHKDMFFSEGVVIDVHHMTTDALERLVNNISEPALPERAESEELDVQFVDHREARILYNNERTCASLQQGIVVFDLDRQIALWRKRLESVKKSYSEMTCQASFGYGILASAQRIVEM